MWVRLHTLTRGSSLDGQIAVLQRADKGAPGSRPKGENWPTTCIFGVTDSDQPASQRRHLYAVAVDGAPRALPPCGAIPDIPVGLDVLPKRHRTRHLGYWSSLTQQAASALGGRASRQLYTPRAPSQGILDRRRVTIYGVTALELGAWAPPKKRWKPCWISDTSMARTPVTVLPLTVAVNITWLPAFTRTDPVPLRIHERGAVTDSCGVVLGCGFEYQHRPAAASFVGTDANEAEAKLCNLQAVAVACTVGTLAP